MQDYRTHARPYIDKFKGIKLLVLDNDGIMTTSHLHYVDSHTPVGISFNVLDGYNMVLLQYTDIKLAVISGRDNQALMHRLQVLKVAPDHIYTGVHNKGKFLTDLMNKLQLDPAQVAFMGDDYIDISAFKEVGLAITVPNCHPMVIPYVDYQTVNTGGEGAVREVIDLLFIANQVDLPVATELQKFWMYEQ